MKLVAASGHSFKRFENE